MLSVESIPRPARNALAHVCKKPSYMAIAVTDGSSFDITLMNPALYTTLNIKTTVLLQRSFRDRVLILPPSSGRGDAPPASSCWRVTSAASLGAVSDITLLIVHSMNYLSGMLSCYRGKTKDLPLPPRLYHDLS